MTDDDVVLRHTLPVFTGLGRCPIVSWDFAGAVSIFGPDALPVAFDRVPRKVVEWAMRKLGVEEWLVRAVMAMYKYARTRIRSYGGSVSEWLLTYCCSAGRW